MTARLTTLPNGLRIVSETMDGLKSAAIGIWVMAGGRHERVEQNGIAHFLEHMAFKGTKNRSALQIAEEIENVGGYINAYTSKEMTAYYARVLENDVPRALDVLGDILCNSTFDPSEVEVERGVILQEIGQTNDTPDDVIFDWLHEAAFPDQALGRSILGPAERVSAFKQADLQGFVNEHYKADRMIVAASGAVDHDAIVTQVSELLSGLESGSAVSMPEGRFQGRERRRVHDLEQAHFTLGFECPNYRDDAIFATQIFSGAFGGGMASRLFQEARERRGLCYSIYSSAGAFSDTGMMTIYAGTGGDQISGLAQLCVDELKRSADDMTTDEVERARAQMKAGLLMGLESSSARVERLARMIAIWGRVPELDETIAKIDAVSTDDVRNMAARLVGAETAMALYGPVADAPVLVELKDRLAA